MSSSSLLLKHQGLKMSHCDVFHPHSVTKMHHPPCCSLSTPSIHLSLMPISASYVLLPTDLMTTSSLHHPPPPPHLGTSLPLMLPLPPPHFCSKCTTKIILILYLFILICLARLYLSICLPLFHPTPIFSASLLWQVLWERGWPCQCQAIPSNDNVYYPLCVPLPMD